jgi:hypothetical protein
LVETVDVLVYLDGSWRELSYPYFLDLVFQAKAILSSIMQEMLDIVFDYAGHHRFQIHPVKSNAIIKTVGEKR